ncbi:MAG: hypothetical protein R3339_03905, partial [Thermodesulfobacteriota bacterium]|nr:hypothetical protein [Thermodesulfobacteriota bacterium]
IQLTISIVEDDEFPLTRWHVSRDEVDRFTEQIIKCAYEITRMREKNSEEIKVLPEVNDCKRKECVYSARCFQETVE